MIDAIGGYFELELNKGAEYHSNANRLNSGRNALEYILKVKAYKKIYLPYYTCDVMLEPIQKLNLEVDFYHIDLTFKPVFDFTTINSDDVFLYTNYFGICDNMVEHIYGKCKNLIIDNSQAFFSRPLLNTDTFYSPRKFFGVPDGAYLYTNKKLEIEHEHDNSEHRFSHLIGRIEKSPVEYYNAFKDNDASLKNQQIKQMSRITKRLLQNIDYETIALKRRANFIFVNNALSKNNEIKITVNENMVPMVYPFLTSNGSEIKKRLIKNDVFVPTYWPNSRSWLAKENDFEIYLTNNLLALPIDQRYGLEEMEIILEKLQ